MCIAQCTNFNGRCCVRYKDGPKAVRTALLVVIKSPYGLAVLVTILLHNLIPEEKDDEDVKGTTTGGEVVTVATESAAA